MPAPARPTASAEINEEFELVNVALAPASMSSEPVPVSPIAAPFDPVFTELPAPVTVKAPEAFANVPLVRPLRAC